MGDTIDRDVGAQAKGFRLQKLRAAKLLLESCHNEPLVRVYVAVESGADVRLNSDAGNGVDYREEDKNYSVQAFTLGSPAVRNTLVAFADTLVNERYSEILRFGFYATPEAGKERSAGLLKDLGLRLPEQSILSTLGSDGPIPDDVLGIVKSVVLAEYTEQYRDKETAGNLSALKTWSDDDWRSFLNRFDWQLGSGDESAATEELLAEIRDADWFDATLKGKERVILAGLVDLIDERQLAEDRLRQFVAGIDAENVFLRAKTGELRLPDPTWKQWEELPAPSDQRDIIEKTHAVLAAVPGRYADKLTRRTAASMREQAQLEHRREVAALKLTVFETCYDWLETNRSRLDTIDSKGDIDGVIEDMATAAVSAVENRSKDYHYPIKNRISIRGIVLDLLNTCYLAFDEVEHG